MAGRSGRRVAHDETVARRLALLTAEIASARGSSAPPPEGDAAAAPRSSAVPVPGRHAAPGRLTVGPAQLAAVAVAVLVLVGVGAWWLSSGEESGVVSTPSSTSRELVAMTAGATPSDAVSAPASVTVDVAGKVRRPGIAVLAAGSRVVDAVEAAGGARAGVDLTSLNLARLLVDGEQILVGLDPPSGVAATATGSGSPVTSLVNINTADQVALESLPYVGPVTAASILAWRTEHGPFTSVDQLLDVDGIGEATLAKLAPFVTL